MVRKKANWSRLYLMLAGLALLLIALYILTIYEGREKQPGPEPVPPAEQVDSVLLK